MPTPARRGPASAETYNRRPHQAMNNQMPRRGRAGMDKIEAAARAGMPPPTRNAAQPAEQQSGPSCRIG